MTRQPTAAQQDYLKTIHHLDGEEKEVTPTALAARLGVRASSVSGMFKRLGQAGWARHQPGSGALLTPTGLAEARRVIRRHRLLKLLLTRVLGMDWGEVDAEAEILEHAVSDRVEQALAALLGDPPEDPHGQPIPTRDGRLERRRLTRLCDFRPGQRVIVREAEDDRPERLRRWRELGLVPGAAVHLVGHDPVEDLFRLQVGNRVILVASAGLKGLLGEVAADR